MAAFSECPKPLAEMGVVDANAFECHEASQTLEWKIAGKEKYIDNEYVQASAYLRQSCGKRYESQTEKNGSRSLSR